MGRPTSVSPLLRLVLHLVCGLVVHCSEGNDGVLLELRAREGRSLAAFGFPSSGSPAAIGELDSFTLLLAAMRLWEAIDTGSLENVKEILGNQEKDILEAQNSEGFTAVGIAAATGNLPIVKFLIKQGVDVNAKSFFQQSPVHLAAKSGDPEVLSAILKAGGDPKDVTLVKETPLHFAPVNDGVEVIEILLDAGVDINQTDLHLDTALHEAALFGAAKSVKLLLERGIDARKRDLDGMTAKEVICKCKNPATSIVKLCSSGQCTAPDIERVKATFDAVGDGAEAEHAKLACVMRVFNPAHTTLCNFENDWTDLVTAREAGVQFDRAKQERSTQSKGDKKKPKKKSKKKSPKKKSITPQKSNQVTIKELEALLKDREEQKKKRG